MLPNAPRGAKCSKIPPSTPVDHLKKGSNGKFANNADPVRSKFMVRASGQVVNLSDGDRMLVLNFEGRVDFVMII